jgi:GT2 family glycosyltransferase
VAAFAGIRSQAVTADGAAATPCEIGWTTGAALAVRRSLWSQLEGFDPAYGRGYYEDVDFCLRARRLGFKVWFEPDCTLVHTVGSTGGSRELLDNALRFQARWGRETKLDRAALKVGSTAPHGDQRQVRP